MATTKTQSAEDTQKQIDRISYLASLVSQKQQIDPYLDSLRLITALQEDGNLTLKAEDAAKLTWIEEKLTEHLITKEPLRNFTRESLQQSLYERLQAGGLIRRLQWEVTAIVALAIMTFAGIMSMSFNTVSVRADIALVAAIIVFYIGGVFLFLTALDKFSPAVRTGYRLFSIGMVIGSLSIFANDVANIIYGGAPPWSWLWPINLGLYLEFIPIYIASVQLAKVQGVKSRLMDWRVVTPIVLVGAGLLALIPEGRAVEVVGGLTPYLTWIAFSLSWSGAYVFHLVWKSSTPLYKSPSRALSISLFMSGIGWAITVITPFMPPHLYEGVSMSSNIFFIITTGFLVRAGYAFNKLSRQ